MTDLLIVKADREKTKFKIVQKANNSWSAPKFERIIRNKDYNPLAYLFYDLKNLGYPIDKAIQKFIELSKKPDLFFLE